MYPTMCQLLGSLKWCLFTHPRKRLAQNAYWCETWQRGYHATISLTTQWKNRLIGSDWRRLWGIRVNSLCSSRTQQQWSSDPPPSTMLSKSGEHDVSSPLRTLGFCLSVRLSVGTYPQFILKKIHRKKDTIGYFCFECIISLCPET